MTSLTTLAVLRLVHILAGVFWVGTAVFVTAFLMPTVRAIGPAGGQVMQQLAQVRKLPAYLMAAGMLTILSGLTLYWRVSDGFQSTVWLGSGTAKVLGAGGLLATAAMAVARYVP